LRFELTTSVVIGTDCIGSCKSNYHPIMATTALAFKVQCRSLIIIFIAGNFIRHGCSAFGEVEHMNKKTPNYVQHLFDCLESGTRFKIENGHVTFTNRYYKYTEM